MKWLLFPCCLALASCGGSSNVTSPDDAPAALNDNPQGVADDGSPTTIKSPSGSSTINRDNHDAILAEVFKVYSGRAFESQLSSFDFESGEFGPIIADGIEGTTYSCDNGGTVEVSIIEDFSYFRTAYTFENCALGDKVLQGDYRVIESEEEILRSSENGLTVTINADTTVEFSGLAAFSCCLSSIWYVRVNEFDYQFSSPAERFSVVESTTHFSDGEDFVSETRSASLTGSFGVETPVSGFERLSVAVETELAYESEAGLPYEVLDGLIDTWTFTEGRLNVTAADGSYLELDADSGDESTVQITIENGDGREVFDQPWSLWRGVLNVADR